MAWKSRRKASTAGSLEQDMLDKWGLELEHAPEELTAITLLE